MSFKGCLLYWLYTIVLTVILFGCGKMTIQVQGEATVNHKVTVDLKSLEKYFNVLCSRGLASSNCQAPSIEQCTDCMIAEVLE